MNKERELLIIRNYIGLDVKSVRELDMGRTTHLIHQLAGQSTPVTIDAMIVATREGYNWRNYGALNLVTSETAVYLDCLVRQNELTKSGSFIPSEDRLTELTREGVLE